MSSWGENSNNSMPQRGDEPHDSSPLSPKRALPPLAPLLSDHHIIDGLTSDGQMFVFVYSPRAQSLLSWSPNAATVLGVHDVAITRDGNLFLRHVHPDDRFSLFADLERALNGHGSYRATYRWIRPDTNQVRWLHCRGGLRSREGESLFEGFVIDLSAELSESVGLTNRLDSPASIVATLPFTVFTLDRDLRLGHLHRACSDNRSTDFGDPNFHLERFTSGTPFLEAFSHDDVRRELQRALEALLRGEIARHEMRIGAVTSVAAIEFVPILEHGVPAGILGRISDVTTQMTLEARVAELQKIAGLHTVALGLAHHCNNALQRIIGQASMLCEYADDPAAVTRIAAAITEVAGRAGDLTRQLCASDDDSDATAVPVDLNLVTLAATNRVKDLFSSGLKISVAFGSNTTALGRHEPLVDVVEHALRAMWARSSRNGSWSITTSDCPVAGEDGNVFVRLAVRETGGSELPAEISPTDAVELQRAVARFNGAIIFGKEKDGGYLLAIDLPSSAQLSDSPTGAPPPAAELSAPEVLLVDDDGMVLETMAAILREHGFQTLTAIDGASAVRAVREHAATLRLVLLDGVMPGTSGASVLRRILRRAPHLKILGFSGAPPHVTDALLEAGALGIVRKPIEPAALKAAVEAFLRGKCAA